MTKQEFAECYLQKPIAFKDIASLLKILNVLKAWYKKSLLIRTKKLQLSKENLSM